jgi:hypothetical protein
MFRFALSYKGGARSNSAHMGALMSIKRRSKELEETKGETSPVRVLIGS